LSESLPIQFDSKESAKFVNPDEFVHLLYNEASFLRSRFYF